MKGPVVVQLGVAEVLIRQVAEVFQGVGDRPLAGADLLEEGLELLGGHDALFYLINEKTLGRRTEGL